jgi:hypothetical protein
VRSALEDDSSRPVTLGVSTQLRFRLLTAAEMRSVRSYASHVAVVRLDPTRVSRVTNAGQLFGASSVL